MIGCVYENVEIFLNMQSRIACDMRTSGVCLSLNTAKISLKFFFDSL